jgi:hypothetical protein
MSSGQFLDIVVLKGKFSIQSPAQSGIFLAFFNVVDEYISDISSIIVSNQSLFDKVRIFDDWKILYNDMVGYKSSGAAVDSGPLADFLLDSFIEFDLFPLVQDSNLDELTKSTGQIIARSFNSPAQVQVEIEKTSSLQLEMTGIAIDQPADESQEAAAGQDARPVQLTAEETRMNKIESEAKYVIEGKAIVAPVKGKYINDINVGDKIKLMLSASDPVSEKILRVLGAIDEERNISAIRGRVKEKIPLERGYAIYALVAKDVLAKIIEEENVKILIDRPATEEQVSEKSDSRMMFAMIILLGLVIVMGIIIFNLL